MPECADAIDFESFGLENLSSNSATSTAGGVDAAAGSDGRAAGSQRVCKIRVQNLNVKPTTCQSGRISPGKTHNDICLLLLLFKHSLKRTAPKL